MAETRYCGRCGEPRVNPADRFCQVCGAVYELRRAGGAETVAAPRSLAQILRGWTGAALGAAGLAVVAGAFFMLGEMIAREPRPHALMPHPAQVAQAPAARSSPPLADLIRHVRPAVVTIEVYDAKGRDRGFGSGFFVARDGRIITSHHVMAGAVRAEVTLEDGSVHPVAYVLADDRGSDLCELLVLLEHDTPFLSISGNKPEVGDRVIAVGSPLGFNETVSEGIISALPEERRGDLKDLGPATLQITAAISQGSSGGPVVDTDALVVGVANTTFLDAQALNFAVPARAVLALAPLVPRTVANWHRRNWKPDAAGWYDAGYAAWYIGDAARADGYFASAARRDPRLAEAWWGRGVCAEQLGKPALARAYLEQAVALKPRFALAHYDLARVESELGRSAEAARERALAARLDPKLAASQAHSSAHRLPH